MILRSQFSLIAVLLFSTFSIHAQTLTFSYEDRENPPYFYQNKDDPSKHSGVTIDVLRLVAKRLSFKIEFVRLPWLRGLLKLKHNKIDGVFHSSFKSKRMEYGLYPMTEEGIDNSRMLMVQRYYLYTHKDSKLHWNGEKFSHLKGSIGALNGYAIVSDLENKGISIKKSENLLPLLHQIQEERLEGMVNLENMTDALIKNNPSELEHVIKISPPVKEKSYFLMLSHGFYKSQPELSNSIWNEIKNIKDSGDYQRILNTY